MHADLLLTSLYPGLHMVRTGAGVAPQMHTRSTIFVSQLVTRIIEAIILE